MRARCDPLLSCTDTDISNRLNTTRKNFSPYNSSVPFVSVNLLLLQVSFFPFEIIDAVTEQHVITQSHFSIKDVKITRRNGGVLKNVWSINDVHEGLWNLYPVELSFTILALFNFSI